MFSNIYKPKITKSKQCKNIELIIQNLSNILLIPITKMYISNKNHKILHANSYKMRNYIYIMINMSLFIYCYSPANVLEMRKKYLDAYKCKN